jgi:uncharacterized protein YjbJ (UPF0337 family)
MVDIKEIQGKINQASGDLTDDQQQVLKGHIQEAIGKGKDSGENSMNELSRTINNKIEEFKRKNRENK